MTLLLAKFKSKKEANLVASYIRNMKKEVQLMKEENWDDFFFGQLINEGMKEKGTVSLASVRKKLKG
ncbi:MAG: hypothetical protein NTY88_05060 [Bacteroidetes bacterium]|nr:hypothetical protein [Bacteroidota bacterium]